MRPPNLYLKNEYINRDDSFNVDCDAAVSGETDILSLTFKCQGSTAVVLLALSVCNLFSRFLGLITIK